MLRLSIVFFLITATAVADDNVFKNTDVFELEVAADPQISPDGSRIAYVRRSMDIMTDRAVSNIWMVDADGSNHRPVLSGARSFSSPRRSPTGDRLAYISSVEGRGAEVHVRWMDSGQTALLSNLRRSPAALSWSPDGKQIAFEMFVESEGASLAKAVKAPEGADWAPPVKVIEQMTYRSDGDGYLDVGNTHLFVLSAEGGTPRQLSSGDYDDDGPLAWSASGEQLYFSANRQAEWQHDPLESELWSVDVASGDLKQLTDRNGPDFSPAISPDGSKLAYLGFDDKKMGYHVSNVYVLDLGDGSSRALTENFDRSIDDVQWAGNSSRLLVTYDDHGRKHLARLAMDGKISSLADDVGGVSLGRPYTSGGFSVASNGTYAYSAGRPGRPADVASGRANRSPKRITDLNEDLFGHKSLGEVKEIKWQSSFDELEIQGWLVTPPDFDAAKNIR